MKIAEVVLALSHTVCVCMVYLFNPVPVSSLLHGAANPRLSESEACGVPVQSHSWLDLISGMSHWGVPQPAIYNVDLLCHVFLHSVQLGNNVQISGECDCVMFGARGSYSRIFVFIIPQLL